MHKLVNGPTSSSLFPSEFSSVSQFLQMTLSNKITDVPTYCNTLTLHLLTQKIILPPKNSRISKI